MNKQITIVKYTKDKIEIKDIDNTLESFQKEVKGYIETINLCDNYCLICDEEGKLKKDNYFTLFIEGHNGFIEIVGDCFICKVTSTGKFKSLNSIEANYLSENLNIKVRRYLNLND